MSKDYEQWQREEADRLARWPAICAGCGHRQRFHMWSKSNHQRSRK